jgi:ankyrin repeat protein
MKIKQSIIICFLIISQGIHAQIDIYEIARHGCAEDLQVVFDHDPNLINLKNESGFTPLTIACYNGNIEVATLLAKHADNINVNSNVGTPLMAAVFKNNIEITRMLIESGADVNIADDKGTTALHYGIVFKNSDLINLLVENGADINLKDNKGLSPWDYAKIDNDENILKLLKN